MSSNYEGMSNALLEAVCVGLPIVTTRVSGVDEMLTNGENALITKPMSRADMADALDKILGDSYLRDKFSKNNIKLASKYRLDNIATEWEELIKKITRNDNNTEC